MWTPYRRYPWAASKYKLRRTVERDPTRKGRRRGYTGRFPSYRDTEDALLVFESLLELDLLVLLEADPEVSQIWPQPLTLGVHFSGHYYKTIPDFYSGQVTGERKLWEVRAASAVVTDDHEIQSAIDAWYKSVEAQANRQGFEYYLVTEDDIRVEPRLSNSRHILRGRGNLIDADALRSVRHALSHLSNPTTVGTVREHAGDSVNAFWALMRLLYLGEIKADMSRPFGNHTTIFWVLR
jgi:hypothetical protein